MPKSFHYNPWCSHFRSAAQSSIPAREPPSPRRERTLTRFAVYAARTSQKATVSIIGHTDSTGVEGTNQVLSKQRAATIATLLAHPGVPADALAPRGVGTTQPLRTEDTEEGRHLNRSVTFTVTLTPASPAL